MSKELKCQQEPLLQLWADYFVRFLDEYKALGVEFWGLTAQNEPEHGHLFDAGFNCMGWTPDLMTTVRLRI